MESSDYVPSSSSLTTKELQQNLKLVKRRDRPIRLLFDIPSARIVERALSKYVLYKVVVMRSGSFDNICLPVERRYSDFCRFHHKLQEEFSEELEDVLLPRKLLSGNFDPENIVERRLGLRDYLAKLYATRCVRYSPRFPEFFTEQEQKRAHSFLRAGQFKSALDELQLILGIQERMEPWQSATLLVPTLCAMAVCYRDLEEPEQAFAAAHRVLPTLRRYKVDKYRTPVLEMLVDLGYQLGKPVAQLQDELTKLRDGERGEVSYCSLKELVVQEFI
ncbi:sorting nexin-20 [Synchiropus splendidus]|uniref:sorting nexin-20 n=1 Tax=Synchiropus splendidus TaxID=270530 RepID=UPI00237D92BD|nr:sorting nexin-20 [Synchiropus splendidus]